jgi:hypothetical protein
MFETILRKLLEAVTPAQVCWLCLAVTFGLGFYGIRAFASVGDVSSLQRDVTALRVEQIERNAFDLHVRACEATKNGMSARPYREQLEPILRRYRELTGGIMTLPACGDL